MCGGIKTPPYNAGHTPHKPVTGNAAGLRRAAWLPPLRMDRARSQCQNRGIRHPAAGRMHAAPTMRGKRHTTRNRATAAFYRTANLIFSSGRRPRPTIIFHFYFLIFNFSKPFLRCFFNNVPHSNSRRLAGRRGGRITAIPGEVGFAGGAAVSAPPRHFPCPHKAAAAVRVYVLLAGRTPARVSLRVLRPWPRRGAAYSAVSAVAEAGFSARKASTWACASAMTSWKPAAFSSSTIWATIVSGSEPPQEPVSSSLL